VRERKIRIQATEGRIFPGADLSQIDPGKNRSVELDRDFVRKPGKIVDHLGIADRDRNGDQVRVVLSDFPRQIEVRGTDRDLSPTRFGQSDS